MGKKSKRYYQLVVLTKNKMKMDKLKKKYLEYMGDKVKDQDYVRDHIFDFFSDLPSSDLEEIIDYIFSS